MQGLSKYVDMALKLGAVEAVLAPVEKLVIDYRFYLKCRFGCPNWNKYWTCPSAPGFPAPWEFENIIRSYSIFLAIHTLCEEDNQKISFEIEESAFKDGFLLAFSISGCSILCNRDCTYPDSPCRYPQRARPTPSAVCIDVYKTAKLLSMNFEFGKPDWYSYVLLL
ncbi:MAG: hypothetical protein PWQ16_1255 [bacterium]|nr:MAG: hypothetical protein XD52_0526 [bacterium 42_11]MDK2871903.1 hypothetical protein [bacterium]